MRLWIEGLLTVALDRLTAQKAEEDRLERRERREIVRKKPLQPDPPETDDEPWAKPPFWATTRRSA
jgi:hypothetical protein